MKWTAFFAGVVVGLIAYALRPRYYPPKYNIDTPFSVPEDTRLTDILDEVLRAGPRR